ncbi:MAG: AEC family transporter [Clostridiales bacterium]|nr:AEC family transporter [Clostridiales bacterium]
MNSLLVASNVVLPLVVLIAVGYATKAVKWISYESYMQMNKLVFNILLPCVLFQNVYSASISELVNIKLVLFGLLSILAVFFCGIPIVRALTQDDKKRGVALQGIFRSNFVLYGLPIVQSMYSRERLASTTFLISMIVPLFNILAVVALEMFRNESGKVNVGKILFNIIRNPLIIGTALGILCSALRVEFPQIVQHSLDNLTSAATPIALIILGGTFQRQTLGENRRLLAAIASLKLVAVPAVFLGAALLLGFRDVELLAFVALFGSPAAVSSFSMAQQMGGDSELAGQNLLITTVASVFTIFLWVSVLNHFAFLR